MTARDRIASLSLASSIGEVSTKVVGSSFSRFPVFGESLDDFKGYVLARDVLEAVVRGNDVQPVASVMREASSSRPNDAVTTCCFSFDCDDYTSRLSGEPTRPSGS